MQWDYRVLKEHVDGISTYRIIEVYYDDLGKVEDWSDNTANILVWSSLNHLKGTVEHLADAFQKPVLMKTMHDKLIDE